MDAPFAEPGFVRRSHEVGVISRKEPSQHAVPSWDILAPKQINWPANNVGRLRGCFPAHGSKMSAMMLLWNS